MSIKTNQKTMVAGSAAAISAIGLLMGPAIAQALPMVPLAPTCSFNGTYGLNQSNGYRVEFPWHGATPSGTAIAYGNDQKPKLTGPVDGGVTPANEVAVTIDWAGDPKGQYSGTLDPGGNVRGGFTQDLGPLPFGDGSTTASWESVTPLKCVEAPPAAVPVQNPEKQVPGNPVSAPAALTATVTSDVDHYPAPNGAGDPIGILRIGA